MKTSDLKNSVKTRLQNQLHVLDRIRRHKQASNAELSRMFNVPAASTLRICSSMESLGIIRKSKKEIKSEKQVGKPPIYFEIVPNRTGVIVVDFGILFTRFGLIDYAGELSLYKELSTQSIKPNFAERIAKEIEKIKIKSKIHEDRLIVVVGISGSVSDAYIKSILFPKDYDIRKRLESLIDLDIFIENDANLATIAEKNAASIYTPSSILCVLDRMELGTGIVIDGKLYRGFNGRAGENYRYSTGLSSIIRSYDLKKLFPDMSESIKYSQLYRKVYNAAAKGNIIAEKLMNDIIAKFIFDFVSLVRMLDPEIFIFAGEISEAGDDFQNELLNKIKQAQQEKSNYFNMPKIIFSRLGNKSVLKGAGHFGFKVLDGWLLNEKHTFIKNKQQIVASI